MKLLIPYDIDTTGMRNPYLFLLLRELSRRPEIDCLQHGYGWLHEEGEWDVIHLHWPEILISAQIPGAFSESVIEGRYIERLTNTLAGWKRKGSRIILTVHNEEPHIDPSGMCDILYREIYALTDGFIHMGKRSEELFAKNYLREAAGKPSFIIPHGDYRFFLEDRYREPGRSDEEEQDQPGGNGGQPAAGNKSQSGGNKAQPGAGKARNTVSSSPALSGREESRKILGIGSGEKLMLTFGAIRTKEELNLGIDAFRKADIPGSVYLMAGKLPFPFKAQKQHFPVRRKLYMNRWNRRIRTDERIIPPNEVQYYLKAADVVFIPRFEALNSGNVALGFTFGKIVAGPRYGVIGELLSETGNPVFDPYDLHSASDAIRKGFELCEAGHGEKNRTYALEHLSWEKVAGLTVEAYRKLL